MDYSSYIFIILAIFLFIAFYYIWQLTIEKKLLQNNLIDKQIDLDDYRYRLSKTELELEASNEKNTLEQRLDAINNKLGLIEHLHNNVNNLQQIFGSKQHRGLFGEHKLIDILRDELTPSQYDIQKSLNANTRPDAIIYLPTQPNILAIDAKFPYESFKSLKEARNNNDKLRYETYRKAFISDMKKHIKDIANKYIIPGETQDFALLFIPAESIFTYIVEECSELQELTAGRKIILCTPNILMLIIHIVKSLNKDQQMQLHAHSIRENVLKLTKDIDALTIINKKLQRHFEQAQEDLASINKSTDKLEKHIETIANIEIENKFELQIPCNSTYNIN